MMIKPVFLFLIGLLTCIATPALYAAPRWWEPYVPDSHTTALWHFDGVSVDESGVGHTYDETVNNNDGTVTGAVLDTGRFGGSLYFSNVDDSVVVWGTKTTSPWPITIEAWLKPLPKPQPPPPHNQYLNWGFFVAREGSYSAMVDYNSNTTTWDICVRDGWQPFLSAPGDDPETPEVEGINILDGNWHHVACVYDGETESIYFDGVQVATATILSNTWWSTPGYYWLEIGNTPPPHAGDYYMGYIDEVRISDIDRFGTRNIDIPSSGWIQFANDGKEPVYWLDSTVTDGTDTYLVADAEAAGWIQASIYWWDGTNFLLIPNDDSYLRPAGAYSLWSNIGGLTLQIPKYTQD
jgi:hypothetical protein